MSELPQDEVVLWRQRGRATSAAALIGKPLKPWVLRDFTVSVVELAFVGALEASLRALREAAREGGRKKLYLPIQSLRLLCACKLPGMLVVDSQLGLGDRAVAIEVLDEDGDCDVKALRAAAAQAVRLWSVETLAPWCVRHQLPDLAAAVTAAATADCISGLKQSHRRLCKQDGAPDYDLALRVMANNLVDEELFDGLGPCSLVLSGEAGRSVELMTRPFVLHKGTLVSMRCNLSLTTIPFTGLTYLKVSGTKLTWARKAPSPKYNAGSYATAYVFDPDGRVMPVEVVRGPDRQWGLGDSYLAARHLSKGSLPTELAEAVALPWSPTGEPDGETHGWWFGLPQTTRLFSSVEPRTVFEGDEHDLEERVRGLLESYVQPAAFFTTVPRRNLAGQIRNESRMIKPADLDLGLDDDDDLDGDEASQRASPADRSAQLALAREQFAEALNHLHDGRRPRLWVFTDGPRERQMIERAVGVLFGDAVEMSEIGSLPAGVHGLAAELPGADLPAHKRFEARVAAWGPVCDMIRSNTSQPNVALICAPDFVDGKHEDAVNYFAGIHALCAAGADVHHLLPMRGDALRFQVDFVHRLQSALMDVFFAHCGLLAGVGRFAAQMLRDASPKYIHGVQVITSRARSFRGERDSVFVLRTRLPVATGITQARFVWNQGGRTRQSDWMPLNAGLRWLASQALLGDGSDKWLRLDFQRMLGEWLDEVQAEDPRALVLLDWENTAKLLPCFKDDTLLADPIPKLNRIELQKAYPQLTIARIRRGMHTLALRSIRTREFEATRSIAPPRAERYLTSLKTVIEMLPEGAAQRAPRGHFIGCMGYVGNTGALRGLSAYRSVERFALADGALDLDDDDARRLYQCRQAGPSDKDCSIPSSLDITILHCAADVAPGTMASVVMRLRSGYLHYGSWTSLPAPLFFARKVRDHVIRYESDGGGRGNEDSALSDEELPPSTLAEQLLDEVPATPEANEQAPRPRSDQEPSVSTPAEQIPGGAPAHAGPSTQEASEDEIGNELIASLRTVSLYRQMPALFRELGAGRVRIQVPLPDFVTKEAFFEGVPEPTRANIHRAWTRLRRFDLRSEREPEPSAARFFDWVMRKLQVPQLGGPLFEALAPITGSTLMPPIRRIESFFKAGSPGASVTNEDVSAAEKDEMLAWMVMNGAFSNFEPPSGHAKAMSLRPGFGPKCLAALDYARRCRQAVDDLVEARRNKTHLTRTFHYPPAASCLPVAAVQPATAVDMPAAAPDGFALSGVAAQIRRSVPAAEPQVPILRRFPYTDAPAGETKPVPTPIDEALLEDPLNDNPNLVSAVRLARTLNPGADDYQVIRDQVTELLKALDDDHAEIVNRRALEAARRDQEAQAEMKAAERAAERARLHGLLSEFSQLYNRASAQHQAACRAAIRPISLADEVECSPLFSRVDALRRQLDALVEAARAADEVQVQVQQPGLTPAARAQLFGQAARACENLDAASAAMRAMIDEPPVLFEVKAPEIADAPAPEPSAPSAHVAESQSPPAERSTASLSPTAEQQGAPASEQTPDALSMGKAVGSGSRLGTVEDESIAARDPEPDPEPESANRDAVLSVSMSAEAREKAFGALLKLIERRRYALAGVMTTALFDALGPDTHATHKIVLGAACDALDAVDCRLVTDQAASAALIERLSVPLPSFGITGSDCRPEWVGLGVLAATLPGLIFDDRASAYREALMQFLRPRLQNYPCFDDLLDDLAKLWHRTLPTKDQCMAVRGNAIDAYASDMQEYARRARAWAQGKEMVGHAHPAVRRAFARMMEPSEPLGRAIAMIQAGDAKSLARFEALEKIRNKPQAHAIDAARKSDTRGAPDGKLQKWNVQNVENTLEFIGQFLRAWRAYNEGDGKPSQQSRGADHLERLYHRLKAAQQQTCELDIEDPEGRVYRACAGAMFSAVLRMFGDDAPRACISAVDQRLLIQAPMDASFMPLIGAADTDDGLVTRDHVIELLCDLAQADLGDGRAEGIDEDALRAVLDTAMAGHIEAARFYPSYQIAATRGTTKDVHRPHREHIRALARKVRELKYRVQHAYQLSAIDHASGAAMDIVINNVDRALHESDPSASLGSPTAKDSAYLDFPQAYAALERYVERPLQQLVNEKVLYLNRSLDALLEQREDLRAEIETIRKMYANGQNVAALRPAEDAYKLLKVEGRLPSRGPERECMASRYAQYLGELKKLTSGGHLKPLDEFKHKLRAEPADGEPEWMKRLSKAEREDAAQFVEAWLALPSAHSANSDKGRKAASALFSAMGCPTPPEPIPSPPGNVLGFAWRASPFRDLPDVFVPPRLGSQCEWLEALVIKGIGDETAVKRVVGQDAMTPRLVMARILMTLEQRAEIGFNHQALLVDDGLIAYMAVRPGTRLQALLEVALLTFQAMPFRDYDNLPVPREMFFGRQRELNELNAVTGAAVLYGGRRLGKTSLFGHILSEHERTRESGRRALVVSLQPAGADDDAPLKAWMIIHDKMHAAGLVGPLEGRIKSHEDCIRHISADLVANNQTVRSLFLLLDEADDVMERELTLLDSSRPSFIRSLSAMVDNLRGQFNLRFCIAGLHNLTRMTNEQNSALGKATPISLEPYSSADDQEHGLAMITQPLAALGFRFNDITLPWRIMSVCNFYPGFVQQYCQALLARLYNNRQTRVPPYFVREDDLEATERDQGLLAQMREKFKLNLRLDLRYMGIALLLAERHYTHVGDSPLGYGLTTSEIRELCQIGFGPHFATTSASAYEALLNEMVKLNILAESGGRYVLRTPHIAIMIGDLPKVKQLMSELESLPPKLAKSPGERRIRAHRLYQPASAGAAFPMPMGWVRNVIDGLSRSTGRPMPVIIGHRQSGFDELLEYSGNNSAAWSLMNDELTLEFRHTTTPGDVDTRAKTRTSHGDRGRLLILSARNVGVDSIEAYAERARKLQRSKTQVALLLQPATALNLAKAVTRDDWKQPETWTIEPVPAWTPDALFYHLAEQSDLAHSAAALHRILAATAGAPALIEQLVPANLKASSLDRLGSAAAERVGGRLDTLLERWGLPAEMRGANGVRIHPWMEQLDGVSRRDATMGDVCTDEDFRPFEFLMMRWMGLLQERPDGTWAVPQLYLQATP